MIRLPLLTVLLWLPLPFVLGQTTSCGGTPGTRTIGYYDASTITSGGTVTVIPQVFTTSTNLYTPCSSGSSGSISVQDIGVQALNTVTTTSASGSSLFTTTTIGADNVQTILVFTPTAITTTVTKPQTFTTTFTTTGTNGQRTVEIDLPCRTPGLRAGFYNNPFIRTDIQTPYNNFDPSYFPPLTPLAFVRYNGDIAFQIASNQQVPVYGVPVALDNRTIEVETYIYSPIATTLRFQLQSDDIGFGYVGTKAYTGPFTRANADEFEVAGTQNTPGLTRNAGATFTVAAGSFTPLRFINGFSLYTYGASSNFHTAVIGYQIIDTNTGSAANFTLYSDVCPGDAADFPAYGS